MDHGSTVSIPADGAGTPPLAAPTPAVNAGWFATVREAVRTSTIEQRFLALLLVIFLAKGVIITFVHAPFTGHDEVAHYAYLEFVAEQHRLPVIPDLDAWQATYAETREPSHDRMSAELWKYCRRTTPDWTTGCGDYDSVIYAMTYAGDFFPTGWVYTANHPPLYYLLMTPLFWVSQDASLETQLYLLRLAAIPFGLITVLFAYRTVRTLFPRDRFLAMTVPAFVAFQPQISYESAMLNNDILAIAFTSIVVYLLVQGLRDRFPVRTVVLIGFFYGLAVLSKNTSLTTGALIGFAMVLGIGVRRWREWIPKGLLAAGTTALMIWPWFLYMYRTYGDFTGLDRISALQSWWNYGGQQNRPTIWDQLVDRGFFWMRWRETWGEFGWRLIPLSPDLLRVILWFTLVGTIGIAVWAVRLWLTNHRILSAATDDEADAIAARGGSVFVLERWQVVGVLTMGIACLIGYLAILQFGTQFSLTQARYFFPAIVPAATLLMLGYRAMLPRRWLPYGRTTIFLLLVLLTVVIYSAYVVPYWLSADHTYSSIDDFFK